MQAEALAQAVGHRSTELARYSLGDVGLLEQITGGRVDPRHAYLLIALVGIAILATLPVNEDVFRKGAHSEQDPFVAATQSEAPAVGGRSDTYCCRY